METINEQYLKAYNFIKAYYEDRMPKLPEKPNFLNLFIYKLQKRTILKLYHAKMERLTRNYMKAVK